MRSGRFFSLKGTLELNRYPELTYRSFSGMPSCFIISVMSDYLLPNYFNHFPRAFSISFVMQTALCRFCIESFIWLRTLFH